MTITQACKDGNLGWLKQQKDAKLLGDVTEANNWAIRIAAENGHLDVVKWLVTESSQHVEVTDQNDSALRWAARYGHLDVVKWLVLDSAEASKEAALKFGFEFSGKVVDATSAYNRSVQVAAEYGHLDVVKWLVEESGQPVNVVDDDNYALKWATENGHLDVVKWLVLYSTAASKEAARRFGFEFSGQTVSIITSDGFNPELSSLSSDESLATYTFLRAVLTCYKASISLEQLQDKPVIIECVEKGLDPVLANSLSASEIEELLSRNLATKKVTNLKL